MIKDNLDNVTFRNVYDGGYGDVSIINNKPGNYVKSTYNNNGMFDLTNSNIYKVLVPAAVGGAALQAQEKPSYANGGILNINKNNISEAFNVMMLKPYLNGK